MQYYTKDVAQTCNVTVNTVRNWCRDYGQFLDPGATVTTGNRFFSGRDLEVFKYIAALRAENMQKPAIAQRLSETTFAEIDNSEQDTDIVEAPRDAQNAQEGPGSALAVRVTLDDLRSEFDAKLAVLQRSREPSFFVGFGAGFIAALLFVIVIVLLAVLYGGFR